MSDQRETLRQQLLSHADAIMAWREDDNEGPVCIELTCEAEELLRKAAALLVTDASPQPPQVKGIDAFVQELHSESYTPVGIKTVLLAFSAHVKQQYAKELAGAALSPQPPQPLYRNVWIVTEYSGGGLRGVYESQEDAEACIREIRRDYPDRLRDDFVVQVERIRPGAALSPQEAP